MAEGKREPGSPLRGYVISLRRAVLGVIRRIRRPACILFIGNSYTNHHGGVPRHLELMSAWKLHVESVTGDGYSLSHHWQKGEAINRIWNGRWDYVVLQEQSQIPVLDCQAFSENVALFDREIRSIGARTILFVTWERPDSVGKGVTTDGLGAAYDAVGREAGVGVVHVGRAFARSLALRPDILLNDPDGHPTASGTFLAACVFYCTLLGRKPPRHHFTCIPLASDVKAHLKAVAGGALVSAGAPSRAREK